MTYISVISTEWPEVDVLQYTEEDKAKYSENYEKSEHDAIEMFLGDKGYGLDNISWVAHDTEPSINTINY